MKYQNILLGAVFSASLTGCASMVHGTHERFTLASRPNHAKLMVDGTPAGKTPKQINLTRSKTHDIKFSLAGYQPTTIHFKKSTSGWMFGNILFGGLIGTVVDAADGAMYKLTPQEMQKYAKKSGMQYSSKSNTITVILVRNTNSKWKRIGQLKKA